MRIPMVISHDLPGIDYKKCYFWRDFIDIVYEEKCYSRQIWRGQSDHRWELLSSFDRLFTNGESSDVRQKKAKEHLERFRYVARGKIEYDNICDENDDEMWALAQHYGLSTPLLDWSFSPFVALFFAIHDKLNEDIIASVWGLSLLTDLNKIAIEKSIPEIKRFMPKQRKNSRLISQNGIFTIIPYGYSLDRWVLNCTDRGSSYAYLYKIDIQFRNDEIEKCLLFLNKMNINYYTLFPDAYGVSKFCTMALSIPKYHSFK